MNKYEKEIVEISAMSEGDVRGFNALYERYCKQLYNNILKFIDDRELAREILQDVFLLLWQNRFSIQLDRSVGGWLFAVSYHKSLNISRRKLKVEIAYVDIYPEQISIEEENGLLEEIFIKQMNIFDEAIAMLPKRKREVYRMYQYEGRTKEDVAALLGITRQSVMDYIKQSNKTIRIYVAKKYARNQNDCF